MSTPTLAAEAGIRPGQPERYVARFCRHARPARRLHRGPGGRAAREVSLAGATGTARSGSGRCILAASGQALRLRAGAAGEQDLRVIQELAALVPVT